MTSQIPSMTEIKTLNFTTSAEPKKDIERPELTDEQIASVVGGVKNSPPGKTNSQH